MTTPQISIHEIQALMQKAVRLHMDAEFGPACEAYLQLLKVAPNDADARYLLGVAEYNLCDYARAEYHILKALELSPNNPTMTRTLGTVQAARAVSSLSRLVFDPDQDHYPRNLIEPPEIHIFNRFGDPSGGCEWHAIDMAKRLRQHARVCIWTDNPNPAQVFARDHNVRYIDEPSGQVPKSGTLVIVGAYFAVGNWYANTAFRRTILVYNTPDPRSLSARLQELSVVEGAPRVEILYGSDAMKRATGLPGLFEPSPIDTDLFRPADGRREGRRAFTVGRLSRDEGYKYHAQAPSFYRQLANQQVRLRLMGAKHLEPVLGDQEGIELLPARAEPAHEFLRSLDCFIYRTAPSMVETWGRVVIEAMAVGLPIVVHANGGYAQIIRNGQNGFLFHRDEDAFRIILELRDSSERCRQLGQAARQTVVAICSEAGFKKFIDFYLK